MKDTSTIVYLVLTVIAVVISLLKQNKPQPDDNAPTPPYNPNQDDEYEDILPGLKRMFQSPEDEFGNINSELETVQATIPKPEPPNPQHMSVKDKKKEIEKVSNKIKKTKFANKRISDELKQKESDEAWFNARQAIIYSEILKRPEY